MLIRRPADIRSSDITDERVYFNRRDFVKTFSAAAIGTVVGTIAAASTVRPVRAQGLLRQRHTWPLRDRRAAEFV